MSKESIIEKIKKLLALAGDNGSEEEAAAALAMARKWMAEHDVAEEDVIRRAAEEGDRSTDVGEDLFERKGAIQRFDQMMFDVVSIICDVKWYYSNLNRGKQRLRSRIHVYGLKSDVAVAMALHRELCATMRALSRFHVGPGWGPSHWSFCKGFVVRLIARARDIKAEHAPTSSTAIVVAKSTILAKYRDGLVLKKTKTRALEVGDHGAYAKGQLAANNVDLGTRGIAGD